MSEPKSFHMSSRGVPPPGPCRRGLGSPDYIPARKLPGSFTRAAGRNSLEAGRERAGARRSLRSDSRRHRSVILPASRSWQSPTSTLTFRDASGPAILGGLLSSDWACKACSGPPVRRHRNLKRRARLAGSHAGLPETFLSTSRQGGGVIQDTASSASLCALLARANVQPNSQQIAKAAIGRLVAYCSTQNSLLHRKGDEDSPHGLGQPAPDRSGQKLRHAAPKLSGAADRI